MKLAMAVVLSLSVGSAYADSEGGNTDTSSPKGRA